MSYSLNEVEALAKKATRGAGYSWGLAEEAGKAVRFLCVNGIDGCAALAEVLQIFDKRPPHLVFENSVWCAADGALCPITLGAALCDFAAADGGAPCACLKVHQPVFLAFHAVQIAQQTGQNVEVVSGTGTLATNGDAVSLTGELGSFAQRVEVRAGGQIKGSVTRTHRAHPDPAIWQSLNAFAHRTYAPATEESRIKGAG